MALNPAEVAAAQLDPVSPKLSSSRPCHGLTVNLAVQTGSRSAPRAASYLLRSLLTDNQLITWITDPTRFDVGNVDKHSLLLAPAERADVIVDFSQYRRQDLDPLQRCSRGIPCPVPSYDYYLGAPDMSPNGAPAILPGYGPNTRTIMQVKVAAVHSGSCLQPVSAEGGFPASCGRLGCVRIRPAPDHRRSGGLQLGLWYQLCCKQLV